MFLELPSLRFQPKFSNGGIFRFHLPLLCDVVSLRPPARIVILGFGDGQAHFACCQILQEQNIDGRCLTIRRNLPKEAAEDDAAWQNAVAESEEFYHGVATLVVGDPAATAAEHGDGSVDLLLLDDCDSAEIARRELLAWKPKLKPNALVLFHGLDLQRDKPPRSAFNETFAGQLRADFPAGIGLGVVSRESDLAADDSLGQLIFGAEINRAQLAAFYENSARRIDAETRALQAERKNAALELRQIWLNTLISDRWKAQEVMDSQARDFAQAKMIIDSQLAQLKQWIGKSERLRTDNKKLKAELAQERELRKSALKACRKNGRCFGPAFEREEKNRRSIPARIFRELRRIPANLARAKASPPVVGKKTTPTAPVDRYPEWIATHEPTVVALDEQCRASAAMASPPRISLLLPTFNPPAGFLDELFASIAAQTYRNFEICVADGGSDAATAELLQRWQEKDSRLRVKLLPENLGIAENTNRALAAATGDFFVCIDQDDLLAPFALYELACAISENPGGDIFYSDEDRLSAEGKRHSPFFKPEWSPEYLLSMMYLGHLTAYRRELVDRIGGFRKEFDLSQDYDFALRATEQARAIFHVPHVLYHWREHPASGSAGGKPEARATNLAALSDAMKRRGFDAEIIGYPTANRARFKPAQWPRVSIIVPTDSAERARVCTEQLPQMTLYPDYEIVLVTNGALADSLQLSASQQSSVRIVRYDKPFNFSEKCNLGARAASGTRLIFFNDDVEITQPDWIQNLIEPLTNRAVGAVAPKLIYTTGKIQHAGLVTGVRGLVGTACHQWPEDSADYANFAQSMRNVSALSAACLAMRREDFFNVGEFDEVNAPILHSDVDLCFKLRAAGFRCVYTPFATLLHAGHASLVHEEKKPESSARRDKSSIYLLKRWAGDVTRDPFYTSNMRDWLYRDSPTPTSMFGTNDSAPGGGLDLLFVSHDLSMSGAPILLLHLARWCKQNGFFVTVMAPDDGPLRAQYEAAEIPLIIDPLIATEHESFQNFLRDFDALLANTIRGWPAIRAAKKMGVPALWWLHETLVGEHFVREEAQLRMSIPQADVIFAPSEATASIYRPFAENPPRRIPYGIPDLGQSAQERESGDGSLKFLLLGSVEPRKGQDTFAESLRQLRPEFRGRAEFRIVGRVIDPEFGTRLRALAEGVAELTISGEVSHTAALDLIRTSDVLVCASRDEAMPVTILEAMSLGKVILSTSVGGVPEYIISGDNGLLVRPEQPAELASAIERLLTQPEEARKLARNARATFEREFSMDCFGRAFIALVHEMSAGKVA